ncbi:MAG TPA: flagellar protein FlaG [Gammaproteobacteria bacterium]|nr:flagellar protein FlaG [Gammaproteobacteria bacterium]
MATHSIANVSLLATVSSTSTTSRVRTQDESDVRQVFASEGSGSPPGQELSTEGLDVVVSQLETLTQNLQRNLHFNVDDATGRVVVTVVDSESDEVIRQIPPEELLALSQHLAESLEEESSGFLLQTKA